MIEYLVIPLLSILVVTRGFTMDIEGMWSQ